MRYYARLGSLLVLAATGAVAACGSDGDAANQTLPPIATTTTTTTMPPTTTTIPTSYVIQSGDSLFGIAEMFGLSFAELAAFNGITDPDNIQAGQTLQIPQPGEAIPTTTLPGAAVGDPSSTAASSTP
jgi:lipoprotein NlpD